MFAPGKSSRAKLVGVDPRLVRVVLRAYELSEIDFSVIYGLRTREEQAHMVAIGASKTLDSAHMHGLAVDLQPYIGPGVSPYPQKGDSPKVVKEKLRRFELIAIAMFAAADELEVPLQWGNDWDLDGIPTGKDPDEKGQIQDMVHFQIPPHHRLEAARKRRLDRITLRLNGAEIIS